MLAGGLVCLAAPWSGVQPAPPDADRAGLRSRDAHQACADLPRAKPEAVWSTFPIVDDESVVMVPVTLGSREYPFILDTGATLCVVDESLSYLLGHYRGTTTLSTPAGPMTGRLFEPPMAWADSILLPTDALVATCDLTAIRPSGLRCEGLLGMPFLRQLVVQFDFDEHACRILWRESGDELGWGEEQALTLETNNRPLLAADFGGSERQMFLLDSGAGMFGSVVSGSWERLSAADQLAPTGRQRFITLGGSIEERVGQVTEISVGPFKHRTVRMSEGNQSILGIEFLSKYLATIDFPRRKIYLQDRQRAQLQRDIAASATAGNAGYDR